MEQDFKKENIHITNKDIKKVFGIISNQGKEN